MAESDCTEKHRNGNSEFNDRKYISKLSFFLSFCFFYFFSPNMFLDKIIWENLLLTVEIPLEVSSAQEAMWEPVTE